VTGWLFGLSRRGATVLNGDPRPSYLPKDRLEAVATYQVPFTRSLEDWTLSDTSLLAATLIHLLHHRRSSMSKYVAGEDSTLPVTRHIRSRRIQP
jgi:hypothetical protein